MEKEANTMPILMTYCMRCKGDVVHRFEGGSVICDQCGGNMGPRDWTRKFTRCPSGVLPVRDERKET